MSDESALFELPGAKGEQEVEQVGESTQLDVELVQSAHKQQN